MPDPWVIPPEAREPERRCCRCSRTFSPAKVRVPGALWTPLRDGWRCPDCTRAYEARIDRLARRLIADHEQHRWLRAEEHPLAAECVFCDVIRRATALLLDGTRRPR
jgi:hypothetical protein